MLSIYELLSGSEIWVSQLVVSETLWQWLHPSRESRWLSSINSLSLSLLHDFTLLIDPDISASSPDLSAHDDFHGLKFNVHFLWILSIFDATTRHFQNMGTQSPGIPSSTMTWALEFLVMLSNPHQSTLLQQLFFFLCTLLCSLI